MGKKHTQLGEIQIRKNYGIKILITVVAALLLSVVLVGSAGTQPGGFHIQRANHLPISRNHILRNNMI
jgi:hypothetical protein